MLPPGRAHLVRQEAEYSEENLVREGLDRTLLLLLAHHSWWAVTRGRGELVGRWGRWSRWSRWGRWRRLAGETGGAGVVYCMWGVRDR